MDPRLFSHWRFTKDKLSIVLIEFNIFGNLDLDGVSQLRLKKSTRRQMNWCCDAVRFTRVQRKPKYPKQTSIPKLIGLFFLRQWCMGQWMSREMPDGGVCEALSGQARHETRCARHCQADG